MKNNMPPKRKKGTVGLVIKTVFGFYPVLLPLTIVCILFNALISSMPALFLQKVIGVVEETVKEGVWYDGIWKDVSREIIGIVSVLILLYVLSLVSGFAYGQMGAIMTQGTLKKLREKMFGKMQSLPIRYFDTNNHGDIMSRYTNDIDTLRQMVSQSLPQLMISAITMITLVCIMLYFCGWLTMVVLLGVSVMYFLTKKIG
jgi:ATP-binding cassette subfamily B protein